MLKQLWIGLLIEKFFQLGHLLDQFLIAFEDTIVPITGQDSDPFHI
jgi:hypothetical protein